MFDSPVNDRKSVRSVFCFNLDELPAQYPDESAFCQIRFADGRGGTVRPLIDQRCTSKKNETGMNGNEPPDNESQFCLVN